jgi:hypothetical protein
MAKFIERWMAKFSERLVANLECTYNFRFSLKSAGIFQNKKKANRSSQRPTHYCPQKVVMRLIMQALIINFPSRDCWAR